MFELFDERARSVVVHAQEEARLLRHAVIGGDHLLLGVARVQPELVDASMESLRGAVRAVRGSGKGDPVASLPFTAEAQKALRRATSAARAAGREWVVPAHLLLALLAVDPLVGGVLTTVQLDVEAIRGRAGASAARPQPVRDYEQALRAGQAVSVSLGGGLPIGDVGHPHTDARLLLAILAGDSSVAKALREHGLDEDAARALGER